MKVDYFPAGQNPWERSDLYWALMEGLLDDIWSPDVIREWRAARDLPLRRAKHFV